MWAGRWDPISPPAVQGHDDCICSLQGGKDHLTAPEWAKKECGREWRCSGWRKEWEEGRGEKKGEKEWERRGRSYGCSKGTQASLKRMWDCPQGVRGHLLPPHCIVHPHWRSGFFLGEALHSVSQFNRLVVSDSLRPHGLQHARFPCPSPTPRACPNSCPSRQWCHPTILSSVIPFFSCLQSFPASGSFPMSQFFSSGGQSIGVSASASVFPVNIQDWFPLGWTGWIS